MKDKYPKLFQLIVDDLNRDNEDFLPLGYGGLYNYFEALTFAVITLSVKDPEMPLGEAYELAREATSEYFDNRKTSVLQEETA